MKKKNFQLLTFGELLMRFSPEENKKIAEGDRFQSFVGGAEFNVAATASQLGLPCGILSKIPSNSIGTLVRNKVHSYGIGSKYLVMDESPQARLGIYYYEHGAYPRKPQIVYDRKNTSFCTLEQKEIPADILESTDCFFTSGITLALGELTKENGLAIIQKMKKYNVKIAFDVNYRGNLWSGEEAKECIESFLSQVDIFFCSEDTARLTFGKTGEMKDIMKSFAKEYGISVVASTKRIVHSPKRHTFSAMIYDASQDLFLEEEPYCDIEVIDRIGSGDAFVAGVLYGLLSDGGNCEQAITYGTALGAVKNTIAGDIALVSKKEIDEIIRVHKSKEFEREMIR